MTLVSKLRAALEISAQSAARDDELRTRLLAAIDNDFSGGRTVVLDGWVLSLTEARLAAVSTLYSQERGGRT